MTDGKIEKSETNEQIRKYAKPVVWRMTHADASKLADLAKDSGLSRSDVLRRLIRATPLPTPMPKVDQEALKELSRVGSNLNQISKAINKGDKGLTIIGQAVVLMDATQEAVRAVLKTVKGTS